MLVPVFPFSFVNSSIQPGKYAETVKLALEPGPFIPTAFRAEPGTFSVGQTVF
jgi:hypothetical protein